MNYDDEYDQCREELTDEEVRRPKKNSSKSGKSSKGGKSSSSSKSTKSSNKGGREKPKKKPDPEPEEEEAEEDEEEEVDEDEEEEEEEDDEMAKLDEKVGFMGGGMMAYAIASGMVNRGIVKPNQILASGPHPENMKRWKDMGASITTENEDVLIKSDIIFICVKPPVVEGVSQEIQKQHIRSVRDKDKLFVSVVAGISIEVLEKFFYFIPEIKIVRCMPNTAMQVAEGCTVFTAGRYVPPVDVEKISMIFNALGMAHEVPEKMINAFSAIMGSGPAYVYMIIEALADGGVKMGIPKATAIQFAAQTLYGSAKTLLETGKHPAVLKDEVCSPGGTSICGVHELEKGGMRNLLINAVEAATVKSNELGKADTE